MTTLWIFNPETDLVLGLDTAIYTPKKSIIEMRRRFSPVASLFASPGDYVLSLDPLSEKRLFLARGVDWLPLTRLRDMALPYRISPWGWNKALRNLLLKHGADPSSVPSEARIREMRRIADRRFTVIFNEAMGMTQLPRVCSDVREVKEELARCGALFLKTPWSTAGKGKLAASVWNEETRKWVEGAIAAKGYVMAERLCRDKAMDLASEWECSNGEAVFRGISIFTTENNRYASNISKPQTHLFRHLRGYDIFSVVRRQRQAIAELIAPYYEGPLGIDMMATGDSEIVPCVEINLRHTMGMAAIAFHKMFPQEEAFIPSRISSYLSR